MSESFIQGQFSKDKSVYIGNSITSFPSNRLGYGITGGDWGFTPVGVFIYLNDIKNDPYFEGRNGISLLAIPSESVYWALSDKYDTWYTFNQAEGMLKDKTYMNSTSFYVGDTGDGGRGQFNSYRYDYYLFRDLEGLYFDAVKAEVSYGYPYSSSFYEFMCQLRSKAGMTKYEVH